MRQSLNTSAAIAALALAGLSQPALAQDTSSPASETNATEDAGHLEEIVVTAQKREQNVQKVPIAISVATKSDIERLQVTNVASLQYATPSLVVVSADPSRQNFGIRGVSDNSRNPGYDNRVGVYVDGVWIGRSAASNQNAYDVQSIEILRGPQGTLFGKNTVAGAISITTQKPKLDGVSGSLEGEAGNYGLLRTKGSLNVPLGGDMAVRVSGSYLSRDGFTQNVYNHLDYDNRHGYNFRGQFLYDNGTTKVYLAADTGKQDLRSLAGGEKIVDPLAPGPRQIAVDDLQPLIIKGSGVSGQIDHKLGNGGTLTSISAYRTSSFVGRADEDYTPRPYAYNYNNGEATKHFSEELRYASPANGNFDYVVGLYFLTQNITGNGAATAFAPLIKPTAPAVYVTVQQNSLVKSDSYAAFVHANYHFNPALVLTLGARLNHEKKSIDYHIADNSGLFTTGSLNDKRSSTDFSPTASLSYSVSDNFLTYARYSRAFKSGGWNADYVSSMNIAFQDEKVNAYEVGFKSTLFDRKLRINAAAYMSKHSNFQVFSFVPLSNGGTMLTVTNAGKLTSKGIEAEVVVAPTPWLKLFANYGYNDAKFDSFKDGGGPGINFDGNHAANAPKHNLNLGIATDFDLGFAKLVVQGDYNYRSSFYSNPNNQAVNFNGSLAQGNIRAGLDFGKVSIFGWVRNVADVTTQIYNSRSFLGIPRGMYNDPRTYGATLKVTFGE